MQRGRWLQSKKKRTKCDRVDERQKNYFKEYEASASQNQKYNEV